MAQTDNAIPEGWEIVPHPEDAEFRSFIKRLREAGLKVFPARDAAPFGVMKGELKDPGFVGFPAANSKWQQANMIGVKLHDLVLVDCDDDKPGGVNDDDLAPFIRNKALFQCRMNGVSRHYLFSLPVALAEKAGLKHSNDGGAVKNVDIKRGNQLVYLKPGKRVRVSVLAALVPAPAAIHEALKKTAVDKEASDMDPESLASFFMNPDDNWKQVKRAIDVMRDGGYLHGGDNNRMRWVRTIACLSKFRGTEWEQESFDLCMTFCDDGGEKDTKDRFYGGKAYDLVESANWCDPLFMANDVDPKFPAYIAQPDVSESEYYESDDEYHASPAYRREIALRKGEDPQQVAAKVKEAIASAPPADIIRVPEAFEPLYETWVYESKKGLIPALAADVADDIRTVWGGNLCYCHDEDTKLGENQGFFIYNRGVWEPWNSIKRDIATEFKRQGYNIPSTHTVSIVNTLKTYAIPMQKPLLGCVPFIDGVLWYADGSLTAHNRDHWLRGHNGISYQESTGTTVFDRWLAQATEGNEMKAKTVRAAMFMALTGAAHWKRFVEFTGESNTGKSVVQGLLISMVGGIESILTTSLDALENDQFALAGLEGKRLIIMPDQDSGTFKSGKLKQLTGGDPIYIRRMQKDPTSIVSNAVVFMFNNNVMRFRDSSQAIHDRRIIIPFNRVIRDEEKDFAISDKLNAELPGIIRALMDEFSGVDALNQLNEWKRTSDEVRAIKAESDPLTGFASMLTPLLDNFNPKAAPADIRQHAVPLNDLYDSWTQYLHDESISMRSPMSKRSFRKALLNELRAIHVKVVLPVGMFDEYEIRGGNGSRQGFVWWSSPATADGTASEDDYDD